MHKLTLITASLILFLLQQSDCFGFKKHDKTDSLKFYIQNFTHQTTFFENIDFRLPNKIKNVNDKNLFNYLKARFENLKLPFKN